MKTFGLFFYLFNLYILMLTYNLLKAQALTLTYTRVHTHTCTHTHTHTYIYIYNLVFRVLNNAKIY